MSFRLLRIGIVGLGLGLGLAACGSDQNRMLNLAAVDPVDSAGKVRVFVATTRATETTGGLFSGERGLQNSFAIVDVSVPRDHKAGELELPSSGAPVPAKHFTVTQAQQLDRDTILKQVRAEVARRPASERDVLVFIHGFNTTFADAALRFSQIVHDSGFKGVPVLFTWPSRGKLLAYPYDRDSALYSRDQFEQGLRVIAKDIGAARMDVLAHSMGTLLTIETLRQASIRGDGNFGGKLRDVMLASPDIDLDVFKTQARQINRPMTVFVSKDDRALAFSRRFAGDKRRLGALSDEDVEEIAELKRLKIEVIDLSSISTSDGLNHAKFAASPKVVGLIGKRLASDQGIGHEGPGLGHAVSTSLETVLNAPVKILTGGQVQGISIAQ